MNKDCKCLNVNTGAGNILLTLNLNINNLDLVFWQSDSTTFTHNKLNLWY